MKVNNYILGIDPSTTDTGFSLGEKKHVSSSLSFENKGLPITIEDIKEIKNYEGEPIGVNNYNFKKYNKKNGLNFINIEQFINICEDIYKCCGSCGETPYFDDIDLYIERGIFNPKFGKGKETLDHLRGFIAGKLNKDIFNDKEPLISASEGQNGCKKEFINQLKSAFPTDDFKKGKKEYSIMLSAYLKSKNDGNIDIKGNDNIADSLLMVGYVINVKLVK